MYDSTTLKMLRKAFFGMGLYYAGLNFITPHIERIAYAHFAPDMFRALGAVGLCLYLIIRAQEMNRKYSRV